MARTLDLSPFGDLEDQVDAVLVQLDDLRLDRGGEAALALIKLDDPVNVGPNLGTGVDLARCELDLRRNLVVLDPLVAFKDDAVDHRVFADRDQQVAGIGARYHDVRE